METQHGPSREQAEEPLREREEHLQGILQATPDPLVVYNEQGHPLSINPAFSQVFGWTFQELAGKMRDILGPKTEGSAI
jgi:PAS domain S-box-containing protein